MDVRTLWVGLFSSLTPWTFLSVIPFTFELLCKFSLSPSFTHLVSCRRDRRLVCQSARTVFLQGALPARGALLAYNRKQSAVYTTHWPWVLEEKSTETPPEIPEELIKSDFSE